MRTTLTHLMQGIFASILLSCLITSHSILAQEALRVDWEKRITNTNGASEKVLKQVEAANGLAYVAGSSSAEIGERMYVARYNSTGTIDWEVYLPSKTGAAINRLVIYNGDLYVAGREQIGSSRSHIIHYAKVTSDGEMLWHFTYDVEGGNEVDFSWMEVVHDRMYIIGTQNGEDDYEIAWAAEFDLDGNLNWNTSYDPGTNTVFTDIQVNSKGNIAACGWADYGYSFLLVGFDDKGEVKWQYPDTLKSSSEKWFNDLTSDSEGNWITVGSEETGSFSEYDAITYKFDSDGNELWNQHFNNTNENYGSLVEVSPDGSILTFADIEVDFDNLVRTISYDTDGNEQWATNYAIDESTSVVNATISGSGEIYLGVQDYDFSGIVKLSANGEVMYSKEYADSVFDYLSDIAVYGENIYACGYSSATGESTILSVKTDGFGEVYTETSTGIPTSDVQVGAVSGNGSYLWLANTSNQIKNNVFTITKMDYSGNVLWVKDKHLTGSNPYFENLTVDASGNSIGFFESLVTGGITDLGLVKYDPDGNEVFYAVYDSSATLHAGAVTTDSDNNIYTGGYNQNSKLMFLSKLDPDGNEIWTDHYSSPSSSFPYAEPLKMMVSKQGKLVIAAVHKNAENGNNLYLFQYDSNGNIEWQTEVIDQNGNTTNLCGLDVNDKGNVTIFGYSGIGQYVAAQYRASGEQLWIDAGSSAPTEAPRSMATDNAGNIYLCFSSKTEARFRKIDASGNIVASSAYSLPSSGNFFLPYGAAFVAGKLAVIGQHNMNSGIVPFEMLLDNELNLIYGRIDSLNQADFRGMTLNGSGEINVAFTQGNTYGGPGYRTALIRQYSIGMLESISFAEYNHISMYPNPAMDQVIIVLPYDIQHIEHVSLIDMSGRMMNLFRQNVIISRNQTVLLNLPSSLSPGNYIVNVSTTDKDYTAHLIKR